MRSVREQTYGRTPREVGVSETGASLLEWTPAEDIALRQRIREYARQHDSRYSARLYDLWDEWNEAYFDGRMTPALILLDEPGQTHSYGQHSHFSGLAGCACQIQLRPSILDGTLRDLRDGTRDRTGLRLFLEDVLLHEMIHQYHFEITGETDDSYSGHGPAFSTTANAIGEHLGLPKVGRTCKKRDRKADEPTPSRWPHNVRPHRDYYRGAYAPVFSREDTGKRAVAVYPDDLERTARVLRKHFDAEDRHALSELLITASDVHEDAS